MPKGLLLVNPRSGSGDATPALLAAAADRGLETRVLRPGDDPLAAAQTARAGAIGVAGGDGTLGAGAQAALETGRPFVCVPFGTRNHFARDLGLDVDDPIAALDAFGAGVERVVDVGRVDDRVFLNNVSIGAYAQLVHEEPHDLPARIRAVVRALHTPQRLLIDGAPVDARVALFANNAYRLDVLAIGERENLEEGLLHLYIAHGLLHTSWQERTGKRFTLAGTGAVLEVAIDGEPVRLRAPVELRLEPRALRVLLPPRPA
jgi:diacylglycerol kinase family enzyme